LFFHLLNRPQFSSFSPYVRQCLSSTRAGGHAIGILCGYGSLVVMGLQHAGSGVTGAIGVRRLFAVALSLGATAFFMALLKVAHAPAGATT
jgi:hypothetical protein